MIAIDRLPRGLVMTRDHVGCETINYEEVDSVIDVLKEMTGSRGPDACIDCVGMEADGKGIQYAYDWIKQAARLETDQGSALREAMIAVRKGGILLIMGVYGMIDSFPLGTLMNKGVTVRTAQQHGQKYLPRLLEHAVNGELDPSFLATHCMPLEETVRGYHLFKKKEDS